MMAFSASVALAFLIELLQLLYLIARLYCTIGVLRRSNSVVGAACDRF